VLVSRKAYHAHGQFDLAHELFHLIAHKTITEEEIEDKKLLNLVESQTHRLADAFLATHRTFLKKSTVLTMTL
jgi:Zn-dependent peptidase ImmA (M78 family)